jgi:hypothetical protein
LKRDQLEPATVAERPAMRRTMMARGIISAFATFWLAGEDAHAQSKLTAHYVLSVAAITIGGGDWTVEIGKDRYTAKSDGELLGIWRLILGSTVTAVTRGSVGKSGFMPADYAANFAWDDDIEDVKMQFRDGAVSELEVKPTITPEPDRIPLGPARLQGTIDPLTAGLVQIPGTRDLLAPAVCQRTLPIFDGSHRYDLALSFKRMEDVSTEKGYHGPAVVCAMSYQPIAGYSPGAFRVRYLRKNRDMEIWFAPIAGARLLAMIRVSIPTTLGTALLKATRFESAVASPQ